MATRSSCSSPDRVVAEAQCGDMWRPATLGRGGDLSATAQCPYRGGRTAEVRRITMGYTTSPRWRIVCAAVLLAALVASPAVAQTYPTHPIRLIVPFPAGGSNDAMARLIAAHLERSLGQPVTAGNRPAAAGQVGTEAVAKAQPDGHTLLLVASSFTVQPAFNPKLPYDTEKDFAPISLVNTNAMVFFVNPKVPANTLKEFVELAKKEPGKFNYASPGVGSQTQLTIELLSRRAGINLVHIPYRGGAPATMAMLANETQFTMLAPNVI